jgi:sugar lactone lactonase YvrE
LQANFTRPILRRQGTERLATEAQRHRDTEQEEREREFPLFPLPHSPSPNCPAAHWSLHCRAMKSRSKLERLRAALEFLSVRQWLAIAALMALTVAAVWWAWRWWLRHRPVKPLVEVATLAGVGPRLATEALSDPFGVAVDADDNLYVSDGQGGRVFRVAKDGTLTLVTERLDMPSALACTPDGDLIVANTGAHTVVRVNVADGSVTTLAGVPNQSGQRDGPALQALFNAPIGVAVAPDGTIYIADTYNDRLCVLSTAGQVRTLAGGAGQGFQDGAGGSAMFDTPCAVIVAFDGSLFVADTGNHRIRRVTPDGQVTTVAGAGDDDLRDGAPGQAGLAEPMALALRRDGALVIADAASAALRLLTFGEQPQLSTLAGGFPFGLLDGELAQARLNTPSGLAFNSSDVLFVADSGNGFLRACTPAQVALGRRAKPEEAKVTAEELRQRIPARWPFEPSQRPREIAGTFGEIRGERPLPGGDTPEAWGAWFHNGLDIPGAYGETVYALQTERVTLPLAVSGFGTPRERLRLPLLGYIHLRLGRDQNDVPFFDIENQGFLFRRDAAGALIDLRIRRGTRIQSGAAIGTLNRLNHVHLIAGPASSEVNALAALSLPGISDTVAPVIENVTLVSGDGTRYDAAARPAGKRKAPPPALITLQGRVRLIVQSYDQADGNAKYRRLGLYRLGYQVLQADGTPALGYEQPRFNLAFDRLPVEANAVELAYAAGSQSGYTGQTIFAYNVTNVLRDGMAREEFWETTQLPPGAYVVSVLAEDFFGNQTRRDITVTLTNQPGQL